MNICPNNTLDIIQELEKLGFLDSHFQLIHHWGRNKGKDSSLKSHKNYLARPSSSYRVNGTNYIIALKLEACLEQAKIADERSKFSRICKSVSPDTQNDDEHIKPNIQTKTIVSQSNDEKLDDNLLLKFVHSFYGYGNYQGDFWFVGMEEGGGGSLSEIQNRLQVWKEHQQLELEDLFLFHSGMKVDEYFWQDPKLQKTWTQLIRVMLIYHGKEAELKECKDYQRDKLARHGSDHCLLELFPLPSPSSSHWLYGDYSDIEEFSTREHYKKSCVEFRINHLKGQINKYQPKYVIFYGSSYIEYWEQVAGIKFSPSENGSFYYSNDKATKFLVIKHPAARGVSNNYYLEIGEYLKDIC